MMPMAERDREASACLYFVTCDVTWCEDECSERRDSRALLEILLLFFLSFSIASAFCTQLFAGLSTADAYFLLRYFHW